MTQARSFMFTSESVGEGHPDKVCDRLSDAVLDACLRIDPRSRVACECYAKCNIVIVGGEITIPKIGLKPIDSVINIASVVREAIRDIGYTHDGRRLPRRQGVRQQPPHHAVAGHCPGR